TSHTLVTHAPLTPILFPYTTLFRSRASRPLDEGARQEMERLPNVVEVYPQIRFFTEVRYAGNPYTTMVAGTPASARGNGAFDEIDRKSTRLNSSHQIISYAVFCLKK